MGEAALAVIGENQGVVFGEQGAELVEVLVEDLLGGMRLEVAAKHLLLAGHDAQLDGRVERFVELEVRRDALFARKAFERAAGFVVADDAEQGGAAADAGDVDRDVGRAAEALFGAADAHNGNRRFGGDAFGVAKPVAVQHGIARHENAGFGKSLFVHKTCGRRNGRHGGRRALIVMVGGPSRRRGRAFANGCNRVLGGSHRLATII